MEQNEKNCEKPQKLTKEELEQVNGGCLPHPDPKNVQKEKNWQNWGEL